MITAIIKSAIPEIIPTIKNKVLPRTPWGFIGLLLVALGGLAIVLRFALGLGATTNLSNQFPWGLWIAFDFLGIGMSAAGFTIAAAVYVFHAKRFEPLVRPAVLTATIGYALVALVLLIDLGRPLHAWHPLLPPLWNHHSVMLEITFCLILYNCVLYFEFIPPLLEKIKANAKWIHVFHKYAFPMVIAGAILSSLHQSSFGSLYLAVPNRMSPLWYTPLLPVLFFISCVSTGLSMMIFQTLLLARKGIVLITDESRDMLAKFVAMTLATYLVVRFLDLSASGRLELLCQQTLYHRVAFITEISVGFALPLLLLLIPKIRRCCCGLYTVTVLVFLGLAANRANVAITSLEHFNGNGSYFPSLIEILSTVGVAAIGVTAFVIISRILPILPAPKKDAEVT